MFMIQKAYLLKDSDFAVTHKSIIKNTKDNHYEQVTLAVPEQEIMDWAKRIELQRSKNNGFAEKALKGGSSE